MFKKIFLGFLIVVLGVALALAVACKKEGKQPWEKS
jgi:uncharacterized membrane protein